MVRAVIARAKALKHHDCRGRRKERCRPCSAVV
jgi:hypothetical protein